MTQLGKQAVVIGGGFAGLLAAHVLSRFFEKVMVLERFSFQEKGGPRPGIPQGHHMHHLWRKGIEVIERLLPGFEERLVGEGAIPVKWNSREVQMTIYGRYADFDCGFTTYDCSRPLLEKILHGMIGSNPRISLLAAAKGEGLTINAKTGTVEGVQVRYNGEIKPFPADFVVDAGGVGSLLPDWLKRQGYPPPEETIVDPLIRYASRFYQADPSLIAPFKKIQIGQAPPKVSRTGGLMRAEGNRWLVTLGGLKGDAPPADPEGFLEFSKTIGDGLLHSVISRARPISPIVPFGGGKNRWRHYEKIHRFPSGLAVVGDAACAVNPLSGHGETLTAIGIQTLSESLAKGTRTHRRRLARQLQIPWQINCGIDWQWPHTQGAKPSRLSRAFQRYMSTVYRIAPAHRQIQEKIVSACVHLMGSPLSFYTPSVLRLIFRELLSGSRNRHSLCEAQVAQEEMR